jgi:sugar phosphate isomerase/epimerase
MRSAVTISLVPQAKGGPFVFWDGLDHACERAAALGFDAVELFPPSAGSVDAAKLRELLAHHKLRVAAIGTGGGWVLHKWSLTSPDPGIRAQAEDFIRAIIDLAASFGAPAIIGSMQGRSDPPTARDQALSWLGRALQDLGAYADARGQVLLYEPLNRYETNLLNRVTDAASFLDTLGAPPVRLLADLFHLNIEEPSIPDALRAAGRHIGHVHLADSNRLAMGFGHTPASPVFEALREIDYAGFLSGEILPLPDSETAARQTIQIIRQYTA